MRRLNAVALTGRDRTPAAAPDCGLDDHETHHQGVPLQDHRAHTAHNGGMRTLILYFRIAKAPGTEPAGPAEDGTPEAIHSSWPISQRPQPATLPRPTRKPPTNLTIHQGFWWI